MRILIYDANFLPGLNRKVYLAKIKYWQKKGVKIGLICTVEGKQFYESYLTDLEFYLLNFKYHIKGVYSLFWEVFKINFLALFLLKKVKGKFDIVYSLCSVLDFLFFPWVLKSLDGKIRWFVSVDNLVPPPNRRPGPLPRNSLAYLVFLAGEIMLKKADGLFVLTDFLKEHYEKRKIKVTKTGDTHGIEKEIFQGPVRKETVKVNALYCGRLHLAKGIFDLVEVVKLVVKKKPDFKIGILGEGDEKIKKDFRERIAKAGLEKNFYHFGYQIGKKKGDLLRSADFFLFLSYDEGLPHAVSEALACNKSVIAYRLPIYNEVFAKYLKKGQMTLFGQKDFSSIADFILKTDFSRLKFYNKLEDYSWEKLAEKELEVMKI